MSKEQAPDPARRKEERVPAAMPVKLAKGLGTTRDVSASGVFFEMDSDLTVGGEISFEIEMDTALGPMTMKCRGKVVRTEQKGSRTGIAVKLSDSRLEAV